MIALLLAVSAATTAPLGKGERAACVAAPARCIVASGEGATLRLTNEGSPRYDLKMDAYRLDTRPCRLVGNLDCPSKTRKIWTLGEPIGRTVARSFGLR